jgi:hypothetical protein
MKLSLSHKDTPVSIDSINIWLPREGNIREIAKEAVRHIPLYVKDTNDIEEFLIDTEPTLLFVLVFYLMEAYPTIPIISLTSGKRFEL